jgi:hypothetical protein
MRKNVLKPFESKFVSQFSSSPPTTASTSAPGKILTAYILFI